MAKSLHGRATIELTDVKTGKKERLEHNNMITNALYRLLPDFLIGENVANAKN